MKIANSAATAAPAPTVKDANHFPPLDNIVNKKGLIYRPIDADHVAVLAQSIKDSGLDTPLFTFSEKEGTLVRINGQAEPVPATYLVAGNHRRAALKKFRQDHPKEFAKRFPNGIPTIHRTCSTADAMMLQLRENLLRREMSAEEIFPVLEQLSKEPYNLSGKEIAKKVGMSTAWVSQMMAVNEELPPETQSEIAEGKISVGAARKLAGEVKSARKAGTPMTKDEITAKAADAKAKLASGAQRSQGDDRKISLKKLWVRYSALTGKLQLSTGRANEVLTNMIEYTLGETAKLEAEIRKDAAPVVAAKPAAKVAAKK